MSRSSRFSICRTSCRPPRPEPAREAAGRAGHRLSARVTRPARGELPEPALEPLHGWAVSQRLKQISSDVLQVSDGSLYPALHKLEQEGWITEEWKTSELGRRAKFYSLTRIGRRHLEKETADWERLSSAISHVLRLKET